MRSGIWLAAACFLGVTIFAWTATGDGPARTVPSPATSPGDPYGHGSPFKLGHEPMLTHVVKAFWTTLGDVQTRIDVETAEAGRPSQYEMVQAVDGEKEPRGLHGHISPDCACRILISSTEVPREDRVAHFVAKGNGTVTVRVYGWRKEDFESPPTVRIRYLKGGRLIGETHVEAMPVPDRLEKR